MHKGISSHLLVLLGLSLLCTASAAWFGSSYTTKADVETTTDLAARGRRESYVHHDILDEGVHKSREERIRRKTTETTTYSDTIDSDQPQFSDEEMALPGKKGIGMTLRPEGQKGSWVENMPLVKYLDLYWSYSWGSDRCEHQPDDIEWVPMFFGAWGMAGAVRTIDEVIKPLYEAGVTKRLLGFNEPDRSEQSNMQVAKAVEYWPVLESARMPLASPVVAHDGGQWLKDWLVEVNENNFRMDYAAVHWYGWPSASAFKSKMLQFYEAYGGTRKILVTEFAPADWSATTVQDNRFTRKQVLNFMKVVLPWLEAQDWIAGYAWFPFKADWPAGTCSSLFELDGTPTPLGRYYKSVRTDNPYGNLTISV